MEEIKKRLDNIEILLKHKYNSSLLDWINKQIEELQHCIEELKKNRKYNLDDLEKRAFLRGNIDFANRVKMKLLGE